MREKKRIVLAAGGTGGHIFPAQALADELTSMGFEVFVFSDGRGHHFSDDSVKTIVIPSSQLLGSIREKIKGGLKLMNGMGAALYHLRRLKPQAVVGFGGYASFPTLFGAFTLKLPTIVHQADAYLGRANRLAAPFVSRIATSFPNVENIPKAYEKKVSFTGLPVRSEIKPEPYKPAAENKTFHLLVTGGSQGAKVFGEILPQAVANLDPALQKRLHISQQCRADSLEMTRALYERTKAKVELSTFLENMGDRYKNAHLILSRAGGSSVVEAALVGRPAIFVPYPYAMDDHQFYNAQQVLHCEGGWLVREKDFTINKLETILTDLMTSPWKLEKAAVNIKTVAIPDASKRLAHLVKQIAI